MDVDKVLVHGLTATGTKMDVDPVVDCTRLDCPGARSDSVLLFCQQWEVLIKVPSLTTQCTTTDPQGKIIFSLWCI